MNLKIILITTFLSLSCLLSAMVWEINQDGSEHFTDITSGISAASDGDTVLVHPGVYYENIDFGGKNIVVMSLYGITGDESMISQTVIDGNHSGTVVSFVNGESRAAVLKGFTITNGKADWINYTKTTGGGIYITNNSSPVISNCIIENNRAYIGSAICIFHNDNGDPLLKGSTIRHNHAYELGAIMISPDGSNNLEFCNNDLNSVYLNYSAAAQDICIAGDRQTSVELDTFTVAEPELPYILILRDIVPPDFSFSVNHGKIEPVAADLYVNPDGSDDNSGLSPAEPLQTIARAMTMIKPDSLEKRTVHVAEGVYSPSLNNQKFPIETRSYVDIVGADKDTTILDMEQTTWAFDALNLNNTDDQEFKDFTIKNFTIKNGGDRQYYGMPGAIRISRATSCVLENLNITGCQTRLAKLVNMNYIKDYFILRNIHIYDNDGHVALHFGVAENYYDQNFTRFYAENIRIRKNVPGAVTPCYTGGDGGAIGIIGHFAIQPEPNSGIITNLEISECIVDISDPGWSNSITSMFPIIWGADVHIYNATIGDNLTTSNLGGALGINSAKVHLTNSIIYNNEPYSISMSTDTGLPPGEITISNSIIEGGEDGIYNQNNQSIVNWLEGNLDTDPLWTYTGDYPYSLSIDSPARDAGTMDLPPGIQFPETDLAGNPRIRGDSIDMGAYEWGFSSQVSTQEDEILQVPTTKISNYPNPFNPDTTIKLELAEAGDVELSIYNVKGQKIRTLMEAYAGRGTFECRWDGRDDNDRPVSSGQYFIKLKQNGEQTVEKIMMVK